MVDKLNTYTLNRPRLKKFLGWFLIVLGFVAIVAPIIPGAPIVFVGFELLGWSLVTDKVREFFTPRPAKETAIIADSVSPEIS